MSDALLPSPIPRRYGWTPDVADDRDHFYQPSTTALPRRIDLRPACPPVYHQGRLACCTGNAIAAAIQFDRARKRLLPDFVPSRLFIYYNGRSLEGTVRHDRGSRIRDGIKSIARLGVCPEDPHWPYDEGKFARKPPLRAFRAAVEHRALHYRRLSHNLTQLRACLASGYPFIFGFTVHVDFEGKALARTGTMQLPRHGARPLGGHAVLAVGYDDHRERFLVRNSWGPNWGRGGHFSMPYAMLMQARLSQDFWTVQMVAG
jgi:C1A family cysteine protease